VTDASERPEDEDGPTDAAEPIEDEYEIVDVLPVLAEARPIVERVERPTSVVALAQTAAVAATGFVAGVATAAVLGRRRQRRLAALAPAATRSPAPAPVGARSQGQLQVVSRRSYLVDVHVLERPRG
jgi:hypothetical protein